MSSALQWRELSLQVSFCWAISLGIDLEQNKPQSRGVDSALRAAQPGAGSCQSSLKIIMLKATRGKEHAAPVTVGRGEQCAGIQNT